MTGLIVSHYRVLEKIGEGGMGVVYKGLDMRLDRTVALKFLSPRVVADPESRLRFEREAKAAAAIDHPNVCTLFEIGEHEGRSFLAMAFVEGETIKEKIEQRPLKLADALDLALQAARGLEAAHGRGIVHRDIKPANVMVNSQGQARIMDFGLALVSEETRLTQDGSSLGTPAYMSPEQAGGRAVDRRTDIWSLGVMLYEMITGLRPFRADRPEAVIQAIVNDEPEPVTALRAGVPIELDWIVQKCLSKDPGGRHQHAEDLIVDLETLRRKLDSGRTVTLHAAPSPKAARGLRAVWIVAGVLGIFVAAVLLYRFMPRMQTASPGRTVKFAFTPQGLLRGGVGNIDAEVSVSRDGKHITYVESQERQLWVRDIDQEQARPVPGATRVYQAFWSSDNQWIGYSVGPGPDLMRIPARGGTPALITKMAGQFRRASWSRDGETILYCDNTGMYAVPARGGTPTQIVAHPHIEHPSWLDLPDGRRGYMYQTMEKGPNHDVYVQVEGQKDRRFVLTSRSSNPYPDYSPTGHIIYVDGFGDSIAVWALPFSLKTLKATGKPFPIAERASSPQVSRTATLVYSDAATDLVDLVWYDRAGKRLGSIGGRQLASSPALSPDGKWLAFWSREQGPGIVVHDLGRQVSSRTTFESAVGRYVAWAPSGEQILYSAVHAQGPDIFSRPASGEGDARLLAGTPASEQNPVLSPDGRFLLYTENSRQTKQDLVYRERREDGSFGEAKPFLRTPFNEGGAVFSPDGRHVGYLSDESGKRLAYVRDFPGGGNRLQLSTAETTCVRWARNGKEIFLLENEVMLAAPVSEGPAFAIGKSSVLFTRPGVRGLNTRFDVTPNGKRFIIEEGLKDEKPLSVHVVHNWFEEFRGRE